MPTRAPATLPASAYDSVPGLTGTTATGYLTGLVAGHPARLTYDRVTWHWCTRAELRAARGSPDDHRITDVNPLLRTLPVAADVPVLVLRPGDRLPVRTDLAGLAAVARTRPLIDLRVDATGTVTGIGVPYLP